MTLYGIPNCNTVKKAKDWLTANGIDYEFHDFKKKGITAEKLTEWFDAFGWEKVINKNGLTFKKLSAEARLAVDDPAKALIFLQENTSAIKRPIVERNSIPVAVGFDEKFYQNNLG